MNDDDDINNNCFLVIRNSGRCISMSGPMIRKIMKNGISPKDSQNGIVLPTEFLQHQKNKDGSMGPQLLLCTRDEYPQILKILKRKKNKNDFIDHILSRKDLSNSQKILEVAIVFCFNDFETMGIGCVQDTTIHELNMEWFQIIKWKSGQQFRQYMGLPSHDFHISIAFIKSSIDDKPKGIRTKIHESSSPSSLCILDNGYFIAACGKHIDEMFKRNIQHVGIPDRYFEHRKRSPCMTVCFRKEYDTIMNSLNILKMKTEDPYITYLLNNRKNPHDIIFSIMKRMIDMDYIYKGVGCVQEMTYDQEKREWFQIMEWPSAASFRKFIGLPPKDFYIYIADSNGRIYNKPKDMRSCIYKA